MPSSNLNRATFNTEAPVFGGLVGKIDTTAEDDLSLSVETGSFRRFDLCAGTQRLSGSVGATRATVEGLDRWQPGAAATWVRPVERGRLTLRADAFKAYYDDEIRDFSLAGLSVDREFFGERTLDRVVPGSAGNGMTSPSVRRSTTIRASRSRAICGTRSHRGSRSAPGSRSAGPMPVIRASAIRRSAPGSHCSAAGHGGGRFGGSVYCEGDRSDARLFGFDTQDRRDRTVGYGLVLGNSAVLVQGFTPRLHSNNGRTQSHVVSHDDIDVEQCNLSLTRRF